MRCFGQFCCEDRGSCTIEFVLWIPVIMGLVAIVIDATTLYITHTEMWNVARNTARQMSTGVISSIEDAEACAANLISLRSDYPYDIQAEYDQDVGATVIIALRINETTLVGPGTVLFRPLTLLAGDMTARVVMRPDPNSLFGKFPSTADCMTVNSGSGNGNGNGSGSGSGKGGGTV